ncbi:MAG: hypothetical protein JWR19_2168 [Pedosphaera sp.]|nr:hypothetical protein [Pedosphaera sp.]
MKSLRKINPWLSVRNEAAADTGPVEILIYDTIGKDYWDNTGMGAQDLNLIIQANPARDFLVRINSPGGNVWDGMAMYNMLHAIKGRVTTQTDGIAASSASLVMLAGGKRRMPKSALMMVHNPTDMCYGDADDMRAQAEKLDAHKDAICSIYVANSNMTKDEVMAAMDAETWLTGQQCLDCKMVDELTDDQPVQNSFDLKNFRHVPGALVNPQTTAPENSAQNKNIMNREEMIALLQSRGVTVPQNSTDQWLKDEVKKMVTAPQAAATPPVVVAPVVTAPANAAELQVQMAAMTQRLDAERRTRITGVVNGLVTDLRVTADEAPRAVTRAVADETYLDELRARPQNIPGNAPLSVGNVTMVGEAVRDIFNGIQAHIVSGPKAFDTAATRGNAIGAIYRKERERIMPVMNAAAANTIDAALKRVLILNETVRAFAQRVLPLRAFATNFGNVPLQGTDEVVVAYYPLQAAASQDFLNGDGTGGTGYQFAQATNTQMKKITVNKRKYQPLDYSSLEFRRQPFFDAIRLGNINAEKLGVDILFDILSVFTAANYGAAIKNIPIAALQSDDIIDVKGACTKLFWPDAGRSLIMDVDAETALSKDPAYKLALNIGTTSTIQEGKLPRLSGFDFYSMPSFPDNGERLYGIAAFQSALGAAFAPVQPADGVRAQLVAYEIATDAATDISLNYKHWGSAQADRDFEVIESAYGYAPLVPTAAQRFTHP